MEGIRMYQAPTVKFSLGHKTNAEAIIGASLSEPHTSESSIVVVYACLYGLATFRKCFILMCGVKHCNDVT